MDPQRTPTASPLLLLWHHCARVCCRHYIHCTHHILWHFLYCCMWAFTHSLSRTWSVESYCLGVDPQRSPTASTLLLLWHHCASVCCRHYIHCTHHILWHSLYCCVWALPSNGWCLQNHLIATVLYATLRTFLLKKYELLYTNDCATVEAAIYQLLIVEVQVEFQSSLCEMCSGQNGTEVSFSPTALAFLCQLSFHQCTPLIMWGV
jgi:hypothetical protein